MSTVNAPAMPRAIAAAKRRIEKADMRHLPTGPGRREHGRSLMKLNNQVQTSKRAGKSPGPCGLTTRDLWQV